MARFRVYCELDVWIFSIEKKKINKPLLNLRNLNLNDLVELYFKLYPIVKRSTISTTRINIFMWIAHLIFEIFWVNKRGWRMFWRNFVQRLWDAAVFFLTVYSWKLFVCWNLRFMIKSLGLGTVKSWLLSGCTFWDKITP